MLDYRFIHAGVAAYQCQGSSVSLLGQRCIPGGQRCIHARAAAYPCQDSNVSLLGQRCIPVGQRFIHARVATYPCQGRGVFLQGSGVSILGQRCIHAKAAAYPSMNRLHVQERHLYREINSVPACRSSPVAHAATAAAPTAKAAAAAAAAFKAATHHTCPNYSSYCTLTVKGQSHEIFCSQFFSPNSSSWSHQRCPRAILIFFCFLAEL